jgi:tryptophan synthase alpha chain
MTSLSKAFAQAKADHRALLIGYLPAGYPSVDAAIAALSAMVDAGVDVVEVGLPYSDPLLDGPVIQASVDAALARGVTTADVLRTVREISALGVPTLVMSYWNPIARYGVERFAADLAAAGGAGTITADVTPDEAGDWVAATTQHGLDRVFLVAPSSTDERIAYTAQHTRGFIYAAAVMGVTGARDQVGAAAEGLVARVRQATDLPVCVGLGVSNAEQATEVAAFADGVIVGSAFVRCLLDAPDEASGVAAVRALATELSDGVRRAVAR